MVNAELQQSWLRLLASFQPARGLGADTRGNGLTIVQFQVTASSSWHPGLLASSLVRPLRPCAATAPYAVRRTLLLYAERCTLRSKLPHLPVCPCPVL